MTTAASNEQPNGKIGTTQFYQEITALRREMSEMERRILSEIRELTRAEPPRLVQQVNGMAREIECVQAGIDDAQAKIVDLQITSARSDKITGVAAAAFSAAITGLLAWLSGK